jgi:hypothetical protein
MDRELQINDTGSAHSICRQHARRYDQAPTGGSQCSLLAKLACSCDARAVLADVKRMRVAQYLLRSTMSRENEEKRTFQSHEKHNRTHSSLFGQ